MDKCEIFCVKNILALYRYRDFRVGIFFSHPVDKRDGQTPTQPPQDGLDGISRAQAFSWRFGLVVTRWLRSM